MQPVPERAPRCRPGCFLSGTGIRFDRLEQSALDIKHRIGEQYVDVRQLDRRMRWLERNHTLLEERVDRLEKTR